MSGGELLRQDSPEEGDLPSQGCPDHSGGKEEKDGCLDGNDEGRC